MSVACGIACAAELQVGKGSRKGQFVGLALEGSELTIVLGRGGDAQTWPLLSLQQAHSKYAADGRITLVLGAGARREPQRLFISKAEPRELKALLSALDEAVGGARQRGGAQMAHGDAAALLERHFPEQVKKQLKALRDIQSGDAPQVQPGHKQLMMVFDGKGATPAQAGTKVAEVASALGLTTHVRSDLCHAQAHAASCRDAAKVLQLQLSVRSCAHHKHAAALFLDVTVAEGIDVAKLRAGVLGKLGQGELVVVPHGAVKERLAEGLAVHIRHGLRKGGTRAFCSRLELRWEEMEASASPLGVCDLEYFEAGGRMALPTCVLLRMGKEPCAAWCQAHPERKPTLLATSLVSRLEVFCLRLAASASGAPSRPKLLVAGWLAGVQTAPFVKRGFRFDQAADASLGFKMLQTDADRAKAAKPATDSPSAPPATSQQGKRQRSATADEPSAAPGAPPAKKTFAPWPSRRVSAGAAPSKAVATEEEAAPAPGQSGGSEPSNSEAAEAMGETQTSAYTFGGGDEEDVLDLGEISNLGRVAHTPAEAEQARTQGNDEPETQPAAAPPAEGMDDIDAALAELLPS